MLYLCSCGWISYPPDPRCGGPKNPRDGFFRCFPRWHIQEQGAFHEAVLHPRRLFHGPAHRPARSRPEIRPGKGRPDDQENRIGRRLHRHQSQRLRAGAAARQRPGADRGRRGAAIHRRPEAGQRTGPGRRHARALPPDGDAEFHLHRAAQELRSAVQPGGRRRRQESSHRDDRQAPWLPRPAAGRQAVSAR